jgi:hypothetical protein
MAKDRGKKPGSVGSERLWLNVVITVLAVQLIGAVVLWLLR